MLVYDFETPQSCISLYCLSHEFPLSSLSAVLLLCSEFKDECIVFFKEGARVSRVQRDLEMHEKSRWIDSELRKIPA